MLVNLKERVREKCERGEGEREIEREREGEREREMYIYFIDKFLVIE